MSIMVFTEGTIFTHRGWTGLAREEVVRRVREGERPDYAGTMPIGNAAAKLQAWNRAGAEIVYLTSRREPEEVEQVRDTLQRFGFPTRQLLFRGNGEEYQDVAERARPEVIVEGDCESIGGETEMTYPHLRPDVRAEVVSIVVKEFGGIDHLPETPVDLMSYKPPAGATNTRGS